MGIAYLVQEHLVRRGTSCTSYLIRKDTDRCVLPSPVALQKVFVVAEVGEHDPGERHMQSLEHPHHQHEVNTHFAHRDG